MALKFRRGTTAQQSGSLAFGEPYVNTTLGTLLIGGTDGDIVLSAGGTGSTGNFGAISGSGLDITGNANIAGNLTLGGAITIGDAAADTVNVVASLSSSLIPQTTNAFDLGSATKIWRDLYISTGSIKFVAGTTVVKELTLSTLTALETATGSSNVSITNLNSFSGSQLTRNTALATITGSLILSASADASKFATLATLTGSNGIRLTNLESTTASLNTSVTNLNSFSSSENGKAATLATYTGSVEGRFTTLATLTGSNSTRLTALEASASTALSTNGTQATSITNLNSATASLLIETANLESFSSSALTRLTALEVETSNLESFTSSINTTIKTRLNAETVVSGSGQINVASTTGDIALGTRTSGNYVASLVAGTNITLSNNSGEGATPTIGLTNNTISGISLGSNLATLTIGTGLSGTSYNGSTGVTIANTGVTSNVAGTGVTVSGGTGAVTISIGQAVATSSNVQFNSLGIGMAASATAGRIDATNDIVAFSSSDIRFKENIKPIENALDKIRKISGNTYDWKAENKAEHGYEGNDVGVIAQEIEAVLPQLVQTRENGYKAVKYDKLVALLIEGIKEQQLQIEQLRIDLNNSINKGL
jgi:trimeric autotransporter adhesin